MTKQEIAADVTLVLLVVYSAYLAFSNPELTRTQLFIEFWPEYLVMIGVVALVAWTGKKRRK